LVNPSLWNLIRDGHFDAAILPGYFYFSAWIAILAAKFYGVPIIFATDAHNLRTWVTRGQWKIRLKKSIVRRIFGLGQAVLAGSSGTVQYLLSLGLPKETVVLGGNVVDNDWWVAQAAAANRDAVRKSWQIASDAMVTLLCAKLQPWKRPQDLLEAFGRAKVPNSYLVFAGDGPLRNSIESRAAALGISDRIRMLGFVALSQMPAVYCASDLMVLPSGHESFGFVVNEAMLCGCVVAVSDRVGSKYDLVRQGETGYVFPVGDVDALAAILRDVSSDEGQRTRLRVAARKRMETWSPREYLEGFVRAVNLVAKDRDGL
jgi:glycosyltransferase involved in cell wall biosynthesis